MTFRLKAGLAGFPVGHSLSPLIQGIFMESAGIPGEYSLLSVEPAALGETVSRLAGLSWTGLNITVPHKVSVMAHCHRLSPEAKAAGAVNTLVFQDGGVHGFNTDIQGFRAMVSDLPAPFFVLGRGGAARAIGGALPPELRVFLARGEDLPRTGLPERATLVNATTLGWKDQDDFPLGIPRNWCFADLNYNPGWSFRNSLAERGVRVVTGEAMLVEQAACSFALWTGYTPLQEAKQTALERIRTRLNERN
jgi:shikimate dehydrogenase